MKTFNIDGKPIGGKRTYIIGEMAWSHDGNIENAYKILEGVAAGGDAICIHITSMPDYMIEKYAAGKGKLSAGKENARVYDFLVSINLSNEDWKRIISLAHEKRLAVLVMANDTLSLEFAAANGADGFVLSPACLDDIAFVKKMASCNRPIFIRIGGAYLGEVEEAVKTIKSMGNDSIVLIYGFQSYPTDVDKMNLAFIKTLETVFGLPIGFADHIDGDSEWAWHVPLLAVACGAKVIEKHVTYDRAKKGEDYESAIDPLDFPKIAEKIRVAEMAIGQPYLRDLTDEELKYRGVVKKRCIAARNFEPGEVIRKEDIVFKRSDEGLFVGEAKYIYNVTAKVKIAEDEPITFDKVVLN